MNYSYDPFMRALKCTDWGFSLRISYLICQVIVPQESATIGLAGEMPAALNGNHMDIAKYSSNEDDNFVRVARRIAKLVENA